MTSARPAFEFFGGKGGVGKTTCAAARAVAAARDGERVLIVSTDPAHSLGDALGMALSARVRAVSSGVRNRTLHAVQLDAPRAFARWLQAHRHALGDAIEHGTWLERSDVEALLSLPIPGVDELLGIIEIARLSESAHYSLVVVDTAPTGHTLRLLAAPATVTAVSDVLDGLQQEHRAIRRQLARVSRPDAADRLIELLSSQALETAALLGDRSRTTFRAVTLPETLALAEVEDALAALARARISVRDLIVNRALADGPPCPVCDARRADEAGVMRRIRAGAGRRMDIRVLFEQPREPRGVRRLGKIGDALLAAAPPRLARPRPSPRPIAMRTSGRGDATRPLCDVLGDARLIFVGGKGGVGKTTVSSAVALTIARRTPGGRVLVLSTDPAHSLGDVLAQTIGDVAAAVRGGPRNLHAREVDAAAAFAARRAGVEAALEEIAAAFGVPSGTRGMTELVDLAPPGIDELFGMLSVVDARAAYHTIVVDTAPTGHALRLLEMPDAAREWVQALLRVLLKYKDLMRPGQLASELVDLSKSVRRLQELLRDPARTRFIMVTRAAEVPRAETVRLMTRLKKLRLTTPAVVVNARRLAPGSCPWCRALAAQERREMKTIAAACRRAARDCAIIQAPLAAPPPRGVRALEAWARTWMT